MIEMKSWMQLGRCNNDDLETISLMMGCNAFSRMTAQNFGLWTVELTVYYENIMLWAVRSQKYSPYQGCFQHGCGLREPE